MNKRISTLLASVLLAGSVGAFAETIAPTELKTGDVVFVKNAFDESQGSNLFSTYLKAQGDNGIVTAKQSDYVLDTKAKIDSVSWKITVRENARGEKDYKFTNVATGVVMAYDAPKQPAVVENDNYDGLATSTDSAKVVAATDKNSYWSVDAYNDTYTIAYKYHTEDGDSVVAVGAYRYTEKSEAYMVRTARVEFSSDMATSLGDLAGLTGIHIADFGQWTLDDGVEAALTAMYNIPYSELKASRIRSTNIQGLVNFQIVPVEYNAGTDKLEVVKDPKGTETTFAFLPVSQIGLDNPKYYTIDTARYNIAGKHNDAVYAYGLDTDTIIKKLDADSPKNGLRVFTLMREVGNADSIIFRPASIVKYKENATEAPYYEVEANPSNGPLTLGEYEYKTGEVVLGQAKLENTKLVSTVFAVEDERVEGILRPYAFTAPVYPNIEVGYYFIKNKAADKANADVKIYDKYYVYGLCEKDGTGYVAEPSADNSYQVWVVSGKDDKLKVQNRYTKEALGDVLYEVGDGLYSTGNLDTLAFVTADAEKGAIDYFAIDPADINYKKFALGLVNGIGANIYVTTVADSVLGVKADDASLMLYPTIGTVTKYGVNDELLATAYTFKTKDGKVLGKVGNKYVVSKNIDAVLLFFKVAADGEYYVVESALTGTIEEQLEAEVAYLTTKATDNYLTTNTVTGCPDGQDRYTIETPAAPKYMTLEKGWYNIKTDGREDMLTMGTDSAAIFRRISADGLKASYGEADFKLWIDTAANNAKGDLNVPTYFILKGREYSEDKDTMSGNFLGKYNAGDSLMFVEAKRIVNKDTLLIGGDKLKGDDVKPYQFAFPFVSGESGAVYVQTMQQKNNSYQYLRIVNEYVTLTTEKDQAIIINPVNTGEATANEGISTSEVSVIGGNGQVTINGAAGKKVVISNMLGQIKANTVITSDNETIAAPAGIVIVAVEGEEAVKAMVE